MEDMYFEKPSVLKKSLLELEKKLHVKIALKGKKAILSGEPFDEYEASLVLEAIQFGFSPKIALSLTEESTIFRKIPIKNFTRRKNLKEVRARLIGTEGKTRRTIEEISGCDLIIRDNAVGIIGSAESIDNATTAITNLIKGSKQANVYRFLERMNASEYPADLGLKTEKSKYDKKKRKGRKSSEKA